MRRIPRRANGPNARHAAASIEIPASAPPKRFWRPRKSRGSLARTKSFEVEPPAGCLRGDDRKPCPMCGEMIQKDAVKCRFCGEIFDPLLRPEGKSRKAAGRRRLCRPWTGSSRILCSGIGCIIAIIYLVQGKPKGKKMFLVSHDAGDSVILAYPGTVSAFVSSQGGEQAGRG